jgi:hypothetical protein
MDRNSLKKHLVEGPIHISSYYTQRPVTTLHDLEVVLRQPLDTSFGLSQFHGHTSWFVCEVALSVNLKLILIPCKKI